MMRFNRLKWLLVALIAVLAMSPTLFVFSEIWINHLSPITSDYLVLDPVELGSIKLGETATLERPLRNRGWRTLKLLPAKVSCGCVSIATGPSRLSPNESGVLKFSVRSSDRPGPVDERIVLRAADDPQLVWTIPIRGEFVADVWAQPAHVTLILNDSGFAEAAIVIHHAENIVVGDVQTDSPAVELKRTSDENGALTVSAVVSERPDSFLVSSEAKIIVLDQQNPPQRILTVPLKWRSPAKISWFPSELRVMDYGNKTRELKETLLIRGLAQEDVSQLKIEPLEKWIRVGEQNVSGSLVELQVIFDPSAMPERVNQDVLRLCVGDSACETVPVYGRR